MPFEVVPGVTSAIAAAAYAGIPVTQRKVAASFAVVTGSEDPSRAASGVDWEAMARVDTLVVLMGVETLPSVVGALTGAGKPPDTPVCVVEWGTTPRQKTVSGDLSNVVERVKDAGLQPPAVTIVGQVAAMREQLALVRHEPALRQARAGDADSATGVGAEPAAGGARG